MNKARLFGETVEGYNIPVLNEREIRASAGILFLLVFTSWMLILFREDFLLIKYAISIVLVDFTVRVFVNPKFAPSLIIGRWIVRRQNPEYVGAVQKKFAWSIGLVLATIMFLHLVALNSTSFITGIVCQTCMIFLFFESVFGICLGCSLYGRFYKERAQYCPGETCAVKAEQEIRQISWLQIGVVLALIAYIVFIAYLFNNAFSAKPTDLWVIVKPLLSQ